MPARVAAGAIGADDVFVVIIELGRANVSFWQRTRAARRNPKELELTITRTTSGPGLPAGFPFIDDYGNLNEWWRRQFSDPSTAPARFTFQAGALPFGAKVELQAVACHGE